MSLDPASDESIEVCQSNRLNGFENLEFIVELKYDADMGIS